MVNQTQRFVSSLDDPFLHYQKLALFFVFIYVDFHIFQSTGEFKGEYHPLEDIPQDEQLRFTIAGTLCHVPNNKTLARDWPEARGIFYTADQSFVVWVNTTDHVQVTCLSASGDLESVFGKYSNGMTSLERELERDGERFSLDKRLGYIVSDPKHLGTALKVTVRVRLPHLLHVRKYSGTFTR